MSLESVLKSLSEILSGWIATGLNEAQTSQVIVLPVLQGLGYDIWNPYEVVAEEHSGGGSGAYRPDFTVKLEGRARFIIEVKALNRDFDNNHIAQAVGYVNTLGHRWAILTNGRTWKFFDNTVLKPAADKLSLTVDMSDPRARHYLPKLLGRSVWEQPEAEDRLAQTVAEVDADIKKRLNLDKVEARLRQELREGFASTNKGLAKAIELTLEPNERELAEEEFAELERRLFHSSSEAAEKLRAAQAFPRPPTGHSQGEREIIDAIRQGVETTTVNRKQSQHPKARLEAYLAGQPLDVASGRDLNAGIAEAMVTLGRRDYLAHHGLTNKSVNERLRASGEPYPNHAYRRMNNGELLFLLAGAAAHKQRIRRMLVELSVPRQTLEVIYRGEAHFLP